MVKNAYVIPNANKVVSWLVNGFNRINDGEHPASVGDACGANDLDSGETEQYNCETLNIGVGNVSGGVGNGLLQASVGAVINYNFNANGNWGVSGNPIDDFIGLWIEKIWSGRTCNQAQLDLNYLSHYCALDAKEIVQNNAFSNKIAFTPAYTTIIRPNRDGDVIQWIDWHDPIHALNIDDDVIQPAAPNPNTTAIAVNYFSGNVTDEIKFSTILGVLNVSSIKLWIYAAETALGNPDVFIDVYMDGLLGSKNTPFTTSYAWYSYEWTGLTKTQADLDDMYVKFTVGQQLNGESTWITCAYIEVTYEPDTCIDRLNGSKRPQVFKQLKANGIDKRNFSMNGVHIV